MYILKGTFGPNKSKILKALGTNALKQGWQTFHLPCANFLLYGFRCATISINPGATIFLPCRVCLQKQRFVRGCKVRVITHKVTMRHF